MNKKNNIFLIGFMGSGKTTLGKKLAKKLKQPFFDLDAEIEKEEGSSIEGLFSTKGEAYFRKREKVVLERICKEEQAFVMSLGGGTPCFYENITLLNNTGTTIYIKYNAGILVSRLLNAKTTRPLVKGKTEDELKSYVKKTLLEREPFYKQSELIIEEDNLNLAQILTLLN